MKERIDMLKNYLENDDIKVPMREYMDSFGISKSTLSKILGKIKETDIELYAKLKVKNGKYKNNRPTSIDFSNMKGKYISRVNLIDWFVDKYELNFPRLTCKELITMAEKAGVYVGKEYY